MVQLRGGPSFANREASVPEPHSHWIPYSIGRLDPDLDPGGLKKGSRENQKTNN
jgi:hypothetical protein